MTLVREAKSPAYRWRSREVERDGGLEGGLMVRRSPPPPGVLAGEGPPGAVVYRHSAQRTGPPTHPAAMSLVLDIGQGAGLAGATGVRPFLPPLLTGALARADAGIDFDGSGWQFLESPAFLLAVLALAVVSYGAERSGANRRSIAIGTAVLAVALGALLFAGSLAAGDEPAGIGLVAGAACAALAFVAVGGLLARAARRLDESAAGLLTVYADLVALVLAALAIFVEPVGYLALAAFVVLLVRGREQGQRKYAGLRILR